MDIRKLITEQVSDPNMLKKLGQSVGADSSQVEKLVQLGMPTLLNAMSQNASSEKGAAALTSALEKHQDDDVDDIDSFLSQVDMADGAKMLQHILGGKNERVKNNLAKKTGLDQSQVMELMTQLAPLMLGTLGQEKKKQDLDVSGVVGLLGGLMGEQEKSGMMGMITNLLDADDDGSIIDDVGDLLGNFLKK